MATTIDGNPSLTQFLFWKVGKALAKRERAKEATHAHTWVQAFVRLMTHLAGLGCLTWAGFTVSITAGLIVAGFSFFVLSWLSTPANRPQESDSSSRR